MFEAQILNNNSAVYSPWMRRGGDNLRFTVDLIDKKATIALSVQLYEKNSEDAGDGDPVGTALIVSASGLTSQTDSALKEMVRYKFFFASAVSGEWTLFRMLSPVWFDDVKA